MRPVVDIKSKNFDITDIILGAGSFSLVKVAYNKGARTPLALKICHCNSESEWLQSLNEICLLKKLTHQNIATLRNYEITRFHVLIGLEKGENTLKQFITKKSTQDLRCYVIPIMSQIINALNFIHSYKIVHGDIKPSNIVYNFQRNLPKDHIKIQLMDFGLSHVVGRKDLTPQSDVGGTKIYLAPERLSHADYDETVDLFSGGIVFFEILFNKHPFYEEGDNYAEKMRSKPSLKFPQGYQYHVPKEWLTLLFCLLSYNSKIRNEARNSPLLQTEANINTSTDHQVIAVEDIALAEEAEQVGKYTEAAIYYMQTTIDLGIACHEADVENLELIRELNNRILWYKKKILGLLNLFKYSYSQYDIQGGSSIHDEFYDYLMEVTASTPNLKHHIEIGYTGEMYFRESKKDIAFKSFMNALQYLNSVISSEPPGDRRTIIGKKMQQWTNMAETLKTGN